MNLGFHASNLVFYFLFLDCYGFEEPGFGFIYFLVFDMKSKKKKRGWRWDEKRVSFGSGFFQRVMLRKMVFSGE